MTKQEIIEKIIQNEASAFTQDDMTYLESMPDDMLKRMYLTAVSSQSAATAKQNQAVANKENEQVAKAITVCQQTLKNIQKKIFESRAIESQIIGELKKFGVIEQSIFNIDYAAITNDDIDLIIKNAQCESVQILREAINMHNTSRSEHINQIITNSSGLFSEEDLKTKSFDELRKLAVLSGKETHAESLPVSAVNNARGTNWSGAAIGNIPLSTISEGGGEPLGLMSTF